MMCAPTRRGVVFVTCSRGVVRVVSARAQFHASKKQQVERHVEFVDVEVRNAV